MIVFLLCYFFIYGLMHVYAFSKLKAALQPGPVGSWLVIIFMALMILAPISIRLAERAGLTAWLHKLAVPIFSWMGLIFLFVSIFAAADLIRLVLTTAGKYFSLSLVPYAAGNTVIFYGVAFLTIILFVYGLFEAATPRVEHVTLQSLKIPARVGRIRIVQISDVHLGLLVGRKKLEKILGLVQAARPDLLVSTGDLVDGQPNDLHEAAELLHAYNPPLGKIAVTGNHEFYAGLDNALAFTQSAGFITLRQQSIDFEDFTVVGVDDNAAAYMDKPPRVAEDKLLATLAQEKYILLLKHRPDINRASVGHFDLQLSGHTHKGQIFPFNLITWIFHPYASGRLTPLDKGYLYLSRGTATWGPPIRILAPPEITVIDLVHGT